MAAKITPLIDKDGNKIYPPTKAKAVFMSDNATNVETAVTEAKTAASNASTAANEAKTAVASKATTTVYTATIGTSWSGSAAPYTQTVSVPGILSSDTPIVDINFSSIAYSNKEDVVTAWSSIYRITTSNNSITVYADEKTTTAVPIQLKVVR